MDPNNTPPVINNNTTEPTGSNQPPVVQSPASPLAQSVSAAPQETDNKTNGLAIAGLVLAFIAPLIGLILSIIAFNQDKKLGRRRGVALAGIIVSAIFMFVFVGGIVLALVITTFTGVQYKARNTERQTDIKAIYGQVENYYAQKGKYPTLANINDVSWRSTNLAGLDLEALKDPKSSDPILGSSPKTGSYSYEVKAKDGGECDNVKADCVTYTLTATMEAGGTYSRSNLN